jgi:hypothetical protein
VRILKYGQDSSICGIILSVKEVEFVGNRILCIMRLFPANSPFRKFQCQRMLRMFPKLITCNEGLHAIRNDN